MVTSDQRRRQLAREKFERQQQRRAQARSRAKRRNLAIGAGAVVVVGGVIALAVSGVFGGDTKKDPQASASSSTPPSNEPTPEKSPSPAMAIDKGAKYTFTLKTNEGDLSITMDASKTPETVNSFKALADKGYFDKTKCHRLTTAGIFVLQCGDPQGTGMGGPGYTIKDENLGALGKADKSGQVIYPAGTVAMANTSTPNSGGSQFFLVYKDSPLTPTYTPFGTLDAAGLKVVENVAKDGTAADGTAPKKPVTIEKATVAKN
ncbi:peptidylprolyl isomerase [Streptomyces sp. BI20]|uniref:peptidylprolyl isomerase n=1 Tax=Streptomyces sp. BI20 TaxID=3403460 RepID=UPI003C72C42F